MAETREQAADHPTARRPVIRAAVAIRSTTGAPARARDGNADFDVVEATPRFLSNDAVVLTMPGTSVVVRDGIAEVTSSARALAFVFRRGTLHHLAPTPSRFVLRHHDRILLGSDGIVSLSFDAIRRVVMASCALDTAAERLIALVKPRKASILIAEFGGHLPPALTDEPLRLERP